MERAAGFTHEDTPRAKLDKLDALLAISFMPREDAGLLAEMLCIPNDGRYPTLELAPQQRRQKTLEALTAQMEALSHQKHVLGSQLIKSTIQGRQRGRRRPGNLAPACRSGLRRV